MKKIILIVGLFILNINFGLSRPGFYASHNPNKDHSYENIDNFNNDDNKYDKNIVFNIKNIKFKRSYWNYIEYNYDTSKNETIKMDNSYYFYILYNRYTHKNDTLICDDFDILKYTIKKLLK